MRKQMALFTAISRLLEKNSLHPIRRNVSCRTLNNFRFVFSLTLRRNISSVRATIMVYREDNEGADEDNYFSELLQLISFFIQVL